LPCACSRLAGYARNCRAALPTFKTIFNWAQDSSSTSIRDDTGLAMTSQATLSRFENTVGQHQIYYMGAALTESVIERHAQRLQHRAQPVTIDLDPTDDPTHGPNGYRFSIATTTPHVIYR
jgi:hypothetical protein